MADFIYNQGLGMVAEFANRVNDNDPTNATFEVVALVAGGVSDATLKDLDTLAAITATAAAEATNTNYARSTGQVDNTGSMTVTVDDSNDRVDVDMPDITWSSISAGDNWTDLVICYDSDSTGGTDANIVPLVQLDFAVTPDGSDITAQFNTQGFYSAS